MLNWKEIDTVLIDLDGTLLDLHFDMHFWHSHLPQRYAEIHHLPVDQAKAILSEALAKQTGTLNWYCVDYWSEQFDLDIMALKAEIGHIISVHPYVLEFLDALHHNGKRVVLTTNAHPKTLSLKMLMTQLEQHFHAIISSHDYRHPKESAEFWAALQEKEAFDLDRTIMIDDNLAVLEAAQQYGIKHLLAMRQPDSTQPAREITSFIAIHNFSEVMSGLRSLDPK